jgi:hypothetical protein
MPPAGQRAHPGTAAILARCPIALGRTVVSEPSSEPLVEPVARVWLRSNVPPDRCVRPIMVAPSNPPWTDHDSVPPSRASRLHGSCVPTSAGDNGMRTIAGDGCLYDPAARRFRASVARGRRHSDEDYGTMLKNTWQEGYFSRRSSPRSMSQRVRVFSKDAFHFVSTWMSDGICSRTRMSPRTSARQLWSPRSDTLS